MNEKSESLLNLRKLAGTEKVAQTRRQQQAIITEYGQPSSNLAGIAEALKSLPVPKYSIGDIVIAPPAVYGVVQFVLYEPSLWTWIYAIFLEDNPEKIHYFPEKSIVLSKHKNFEIEE